VAVVVLGSVGEAVEAAGVLIVVRVGAADVILASVGGAVGTEIVAVIVVRVEQEVR